MAAELLDDNIITEILSRLPLKSLLRSKCVCKRWHFMISDPIFIRKYSLENPSYYISGFYLQKAWLSCKPRLDFFTMNGNLKAAPEASLSFIKDSVKIMSSCNGLLCCSSFRCSEKERNYYICKPATKQYTMLPPIESELVFGMSIVFEPSKSPHYKVVCVCESELSQPKDSLYQIKVFSSQTSSWRLSEAFQLSYKMFFGRGVLWCGALCWAGWGDSLLHFDVERESLQTLPMPPKPKGRESRACRYMGEAGGHLHMVEIFDFYPTSFEVMEMKEDCTGWFTKYHVDLTNLFFLYQEIEEFKYSILSLLHKEGNYNSSLVLHIPGKVILYYLEDATCIEILNSQQDHMDVFLQPGLDYTWGDVQIIEKTNLRIACSWIEFLIISGNSPTTAVRLMQ
ncbi:F-box domain [Dillenia turbinata]|uniref:F-box domain n=1 Tax=Dillenia turbinata TaxID=194707 RepID=A0AAN8U983_9MAGN